MYLTVLESCSISASTSLCNFCKLPPLLLPSPIEKISATLGDLLYLAGNPLKQKLPSKDECIMKAQCLQEGLQ